MARSRRRLHSPGSGGDSPKRRRYNFRSTRARRRRLAKLGGEQAGRTRPKTDDELREKNKVIKPVEVEATTLKVEKVDFNDAKNRLDHHTDGYDCEDLIVRRGQAFAISFTFDRHINQSDDTITLQFVTGSNPQENKGTVIRIQVKFDNDKQSTSQIDSDWKIKVNSLGGVSLNVLATPAADAVIGKYNLFVETRLRKDEKNTLKRYEHEDSFTILFNPWCKEDDVYVAQDDWKDEYVLNESGRIWVGSQWRNWGKPWNFGQFDDPCLEAALTILDKAELADSARSSAVAVIRCVSQMANCNDDDGILYGRWTKTYPKNCTCPTAWTGSVCILEQYMKKQSAVKYGQCWVFSGLVTTLLRSLGIATRSVTNFESAHDTDSSMTIDNHYDEDGEPLTDNNDSVWNFHVWNESWLKRPDLPEGYGGWQAHDATPQEVSEGVMRCGPASIKAIKEGHVYLNYDVPFVFAEVNGDRVHWMVNDDGTMKAMKVDKYSVGKSISTKAVGSQFREDLTLQYKYKDGSAEERKVVKFVNRFSTRRKQNLYEHPKKDIIDFQMSSPATDRTKVGDPFTVSVKAKNNAGTQYTVKGRITIISSFYTGLAGERVEGQAFEHALDAGAEKSFTVNTNWKEYRDKISSDASFQVFATFKVKGETQVFTQQDTFILVKPSLDILAPSKLNIGEEATVKIAFKNTLKIPVSNCEILVEGAGLLGPQQITIRKTVNPGDTVSEEIQIKPRKRGRREINATLSSNYLSGVEGSASIYVSS